MAFADQSLATTSPKARSHVGKEKHVNQTGSRVTKDGPVGIRWQPRKIRQESQGGQVNRVEPNVVVT
jgi:hypothetical protein